MITSYKLILSPSDGMRIMPSDSYKLYSWLLSGIPVEYADELHIQQGHPVSQSVCYDAEVKAPVWRVNLLTDEASALFSPVLERAECIALHTGSIGIAHREAACQTDFKALILRGRELSSNRAELRFVTGASFKQNGSYVIFPQERLILQSLANRWNSFCPEYPLADADALAMLASGLCISDYSLHTVRYNLKNAYIPAFTGRVTMTARLPVPLLELWNALLCWAPYSGIGIKTALGMGGVDARFAEKRTAQGE